MFLYLSLDEPPRDPCNPNPCGPNSICRVVNAHAVCSCQPGLIGAPPSCRPECVVSAECPLTQACLNNKCVNPCPGTCGVSAKCQVINHNPICSCPPGLTGDPFRLCYECKFHYTLLPFLPLCIIQNHKLQLFISSSFGKNFLLSSNQLCPPRNNTYLLGQ